MGKHEALQGESAAVRGKFAEMLEANKGRAEVSLARASELREAAYAVGANELGDGVAEQMEAKTKEALAAWTNAAEHGPLGHGKGLAMVASAADDHAPRRYQY